MDDDLHYSFHYWLVHHPTINSFEWKPGQTLGSTPLFVTLTVLSYLILTFIFHRFSLLPTLSSTALRLITAVHNLILSLLSLIMAVGCILSTIQQMPYWSWPLCFPIPTPPRGPVFFWAYFFYLSKILEFFDTVLIILSGSKSRRLSFLHVYHHSIVIVMCYIWLYTSQSLFPVALVTNASVHVLMYAYYFLSVLGRRPRWKRVVTDCQIIQFVFSFGISVVMLYYHFTGTGCSGIRSWCFNAAFNGSLLALFVDFHSKNYEDKKRKKKQPRRR